jgi:hypothetical protein
MSLPTDIHEADLLLYDQPWVSVAARAHVAKVYRGDSLAGILSYSFNNGRIRNPHWARIINPVVSLDLSDIERLEVYKKLIRQLPIVFSAQFVTRHDPLLCQAFTSEGFSMASDHKNFIRRPTPCCLSRNDACGEIMQGLPSRTRAYVRQALEQLEIVAIGAKEFCQFYGDNLRQRGVKSWFPLAAAERIIKEGVLRGQVRLVATRKKGDASAPYDAAVAYAMDNHRSQYWMTTRRVAGNGNEPQLKAVYPLIFDGLVHAQLTGRIWDADGAASAGKTHLYGTLFGIREPEPIDHFCRETPMGTFFKKAQSTLRNIKIKGSVRSKLELQQSRPRPQTLPF